MINKPRRPRTTSTKAIKEIRRATRKQYSAEEKIRIVMDGLRDEHSITELCRREGISQNIYYSWSKEFLEAGKSYNSQKPHLCVGREGLAFLQ